MADFYIRHRGRCFPLALEGEQPDQAAIHRQVIHYYVHTSVERKRTDDYAVARRETDYERTVATGTFESAYAGLDPQDRIDLFMEFADSGFERLQELPEDILYILRSRPR